MPQKSKRPPKLAPGRDRKPDAIAPSADELPGDLQREDQRDTPPDSLPEAEEDVPIAAHTSAPDGGVDEHPIHDEPEEDFTPGDYERQIDDVAKSRRGRTGEKP
ncbi:MAG: hypothetical protein WA792_16285 [Pseudolabrys sp.]